MKKLIFLIYLIFIIIGNSAYSQDQSITKFKLYKNRNYKAKYPSTWDSKNFYGLIRFIPKKIKSLDITGPNHVSINLASIPLNSNNIETILESHAKTLYPHEVEKKYKVTRIKNHPKFIYKIEYDLLLNYGDEIYKAVSLFYKKGDSLRYYSYLIRADLFDEFYTEAMFIINSVEDKF